MHSLGRPANGSIYFSRRAASSTKLTSTYGGFGSSATGRKPISLSEARFWVRAGMFGLAHDPHGGLR
jgi:hypothetical protein